MAFRTPKRPRAIEAPRPGDPVKKWNRSSVTRLARAALGPWAFVRRSGEGVELGLTKGGQEFVFHWGTTWEDLVVKISKNRRDSEQALESARQEPRPPDPQAEGDSTGGSDPSPEAVPEVVGESSLEPQGPSDSQDP